MPQLPEEHIRDSHKLNADGLIELFELTPSTGSGTVRFKPDNSYTWRGDEYAGVPMQLSGEKRTAEEGNTLPRLTIGQENVDLSAFKPLIFDGSMDNATLVKIELLLDDMLNDRDIARRTTYRVKRVESYNRMMISVQLGTYSDSLGFKLPYRRFDQPGFPTVRL